MYWKNKPQYVNVPQATIIDKPKSIRKMGGTFWECAKPWLSYEKDKVKNKKVFDSSEVKEDLFFKKELVTVLKGLKKKNIVW